MLSSFKLFCHKISKFSTFKLLLLVLKCIVLAALSLFVSAVALTNIFANLFDFFLKSFKTLKCMSQLRLNITCQVMLYVTRFVLCCAIAHLILSKALNFNFFLYIKIALITYYMILNYFLYLKIKIHHYDSSFIISRSLLRY